MAKNNAWLAKRDDFTKRVAQKAALDAVYLSQCLAVVALNDEFGIGAERAERFLKRMEVLATEHDNECSEDYDLAKEHLRRRLEQVLRCKVERVD